jgi:hypothetical protein
MTTKLKVSLKLHWIRGDEYGASVTTQATDSCYKPRSIRHGLPKGEVGLPEIAFIVAELAHEGGPCTESLHDIVQKIDGIHSSGHAQGVTAFATVNGEIVGSDHQAFPRK